ncbi:hypothetical protein GCM10027456_29210 [Kineosporia babensis]
MPLRAVAEFGADGLVRKLTLWLDWAALHDPEGVNSAGGVASALIAVARSREERGVQVLQASAPDPPVAPAAEVDRPPPLSWRAVWWGRHRAALAGVLMALAALALLAWVVVNVIVPVQQTSSAVTGSSAGSSVADQLGASLPSVTDAPRAGGDGSSSGALIVSKQKPHVVPTVQPGREYTFLSDLLFRSGSFEVSPKSGNRLDALAGHIREIGVQGSIQVNGYTDSVGSRAENLKLSKRRAMAVAQALSDRLDQVDVRLEVQGFGERSPRRPNVTDAGRRENRRVTVVLPEPR